jgi:hypothetical protein
MAQADSAHSTTAPAPVRKAPRLYMTLMGYTSRRPADYPTIDRAALMRSAHALAQRTRARFATYREALSQALRVAWQQAKVTQRINSLARQASAGAAIAATNNHRSARPARSSLPYAS